MRPLCSPRPALRIRPCGRVREGAGSDHRDESREVEEGDVESTTSPSKVPIPSSIPTATVDSPPMTGSRTRRRSTLPPTTTTTSLPFDIGQRMREWLAYSFNPPEKTLRKMSSTPSATGTTPGSRRGRDAGPRRPAAPRFDGGLPQALARVPGAPSRERQPGAARTWRYGSSALAGVARLQRQRRMTTMTRRSRLCRSSLVVNNPSCGVSSAPGVRGSVSAY